MFLWTASNLNLIFFIPGKVGGTAGRPETYDPATGIFTYHTGYAIHAEQKLWPQIKWSVDNAGRDPDRPEQNLHLYLFSTYNTDTGRGDGQTSCTEDCLGFTKRYLVPQVPPGPRDYALKVGFRLWFEPEKSVFCDKLDSFKRSYRKQAAQNTANPNIFEQIKQRLEFTKFMCGKEFDVKFSYIDNFGVKVNVHRDESCPPLATIEENLDPGLC